MFKYLYRLQKQHIISNKTLNTRRLGNESSRVELVSVRFNSIRIYSTQNSTRDRSKLFFKLKLDSF